MTGTASTFVVAPEYRGFAIEPPKSTADGYTARHDGRIRIVVEGRTEFEVRQKIDAILGVG